VRLITDDGVAIEAGVPGRLRGPRKALGNAVVTGDRVTVTWEGERAMVERVAPRRNAFSRRAAGEREVEQVVAANLDQVVIVAAVQRPSSSMASSIACSCSASAPGSLPRLVLNKTDLDDHDEVRGLLAEYAFAGVEGHATCALSGRGVEELRAHLVGRRTLFVGHSGVGKSALLHALMPHETIRAGRGQRGHR
jgi:ribosome biogenesis GTPase